jgi:uncharacterized protein YkwD
MRACLAASIAGVAIALPATASAATASCTARLSTGDEITMTALINQKRGAQGLRTTSRNAPLTTIGRRKSMEMAGGGAFAHDGDGLPWAKGRAAGQNLAIGTTAKQAFQAMMHSPEHKDILLAPEWSLSGVGAAKDCAGHIFFTVNFLAPPPKKN